MRTIFLAKREDSEMERALIHMAEILIYIYFLSVIAMAILERL